MLSIVCMLHVCVHISECVCVYGAPRLCKCINKSMCICMCVFSNLPLLDQGNPIRTILPEIGKCMYVCMSCMYVCMYVCRYVCMYVCACMYISQTYLFLQRLLQ